MSKLFKINILLMVISCIFSSAVVAQSETDEKAFIRFDKGLGFFDPDSIFGINIRFRMQNRVQLTTVSDDDLTIEKTEALVRRLRLRFDGYLGSPRFTYYLQLAFTRSDQDWEGSHEPNIIRDAMIYYNFSDNFYIGFGQGKLPGNRQRITSSGSQQFMDRGINNNEFNIDRDFGLFAYYTLFGNTMPLNIKAALSSGEGRNSPSTDNGYAYTGRIEWLPLGEFAHDGDFSEGDLEFETSPKLSMAGGISFNKNAKKTLGQRGDFLINPHDITSLFADVAAKYMGWAVYLEYINREVKGSAWDAPAQNNLYVLTGEGFTAQASYCMKSKYEIAARYSMVNPDSEISTVEPKARVTTLGLNKYLNNHKVKLQLNVSHREDQLPTGTTRDFQFGFQVEVGI
jgi:phosphate-selective porin